MPSREAEIMFEIARLLKNVLESCDNVVNGVKFGDVKIEYPVDRRSADIAVLLADGRPLLIIETKRKMERRIVPRVDPLSQRVIDQALWYAIYSGAPYFATTNGRTFALFKRPKEDEAFSIETHRILLEEITLNVEFAKRLLSTLAKLHSGIKVAVTPLDWTFIVRLRSFVRWLSDVVAPLVRGRLEEDEDFRAKYEALAKKTGHQVDANQLAMEMAYVLMNKIVFYKILERYYTELMPHRLRPISAPDPDAYLDALYRFFKRAVEATRDFEPIFQTGIYDEIKIPDDELVFETINAFIGDMDRYRLEELGSDVVGFIYEELIPARERHQLGQFYTPPAIAELIVRWAVREPDDLVLDPGCGSGTFLIKAYRRLLELKGKKRPDEEVHGEILSQLYAIDINPFPLHLTALNLASRCISAPSTEMNTILGDFFGVNPGGVAPSPFIVKTPAGEIRREIKLPLFDAVVGNPPYTRWTEIPEPVKENIKKRLGALLSQYNLHADVARGKEPGIYIHFVMWSHRFLKPGGRLGMIISDSWLQTDYGINFGRFLLENFKVKALIDISARVFPVPLIGTCIVLLEKPEEGEDVGDNDVVFMYLNVPEGGSFDVDEILRVIEEAGRGEAPQGYVVRVMRQGDIPRDVKWINFVFRPEDVLEELERRTVRMDELFEPSYGNATYLYLASTGRVRGPRNLGAKDFFYLTEEKARAYGLMRYAYPAITSARYAKWFTFTRADWEALRKRGSPCYFFMCHEPRDELPDSVREYIRWGEPVCPECGSENIEAREGAEFRCRDCGAHFEKCITQIRGTRGGGRICSQALACQEREKQKEHFYGWYDLGGVEEAPIMAIYQSQYKTRFFRCEVPLVTYHAIITFIPKIALNESQLKALLAYLNSSFTQLYIESRARITGLGLACLEVIHAREIPVIDPRALDEEALRELAALFDRLELRARELGGADRRESIMELWDTVIAEIDYKVAEILGLPEALADMARQLAKSMMERRLARAGEARPGALRGAEEPRLRRPRKRKKERREEGLSSVPLDTFISRA